MKVEKIVDEIEKIAVATDGSCRVQAIFGEPKKLETQTIVPVGAILTSFGGGGGGPPFLNGGGVGVNLRVLPIGFIHEENGVARFTAIELPAEYARLGPGKPKDRTHEGLLAKARARIDAAIRRATARQDKATPAQTITP